MPILNSFYGSGSGGGNIGEPLNLTVTSAGLDATITWEDNEIGTIPPTTFVKSELVRKVGSAPTSPSDGTLVVTETVKDTYKISGYVDQGLTEGTTYYYRVFSYSDLGGISYCDAVSVTPSSGWQPGVNTIAYYPLTSVTTNTDQSGNSNTLTNQGVTFGTYGGVDCANTAGYSLYGPITNLPTGNSVRTLSVWANSNSGGSYMSIFGYGQNSTWKRCVLYKQSDNTILISHYLNDVATNITMNDNEWYLCTYTHDGTTAKMYVNGVLAGSMTATIDTASSDFVISGWGAGNETFNGYISELIMEDKARTAQEIQDYFDQTKGDYGIS